MYTDAQLGFVRPFSAKREWEGETPNGNRFGGRWVVRDAKGNFVDVDQYRNDLGPRIEFVYGETLAFEEVV